MKIPKLNANLEIISSLGDNPGADNSLTAAGLKAKFDEAALIIQRFINEEMIDPINDVLELDVFAAEYGVTTVHEVWESHEKRRLCYAFDPANPFFNAILAHVTTTAATFVTPVGETLYVWTVTENGWKSETVSFTKTATVDENSTDEEIPTAKAVYEAVNASGAFIAHYGITKFDQIKAAYDIKKACKCRMGKYELDLVSYVDSNDGAVFQGIAPGDPNEVLYICRCAFDDTWTTKNVSLVSADDTVLTEYKPLYVPYNDGVVGKENYEIQQALQEGKMVYTIYSGEVFVCGKYNSYGTPFYSANPEAEYYLNLDDGYWGMVPIPRKVSVEEQVLTEAQKEQARKNIDAASSDHTHFNISAAKPGQMLIVKAVDENGKPTAWEMADPPRSEYNGPVETILSETYFHTDYNDDGYWDNMETVLVFNIPKPLIAGKTYYVTIDGQKYEAIAQADDVREDGCVSLYVSGNDFHYKAGGTDFDPDYNCIYSPAEAGESSGEGNDMIPVTVSITTPAELTTIELVAILADGTTATYKLYGEAVT